jgi:hypothetical protein
MECTLLRSLLRWQRLRDVIRRHVKKQSDTLLDAFVKILGLCATDGSLLVPDSKSLGRSKTPMPKDVLDAISKASSLSHVPNLAARINRFGRELPSVSPDGSRVFTRRAQHPGGSGCSFKHEQLLKYGFIEAIWRFELFGAEADHISELLFVRPLRTLSPASLARTPYAKLPGLRVRLATVDPGQPLVAVAVEDIQSHFAWIEKGAGTFGSKKPFIAMVTLDRGKQEVFEGI